MSAAEGPPCCKCGKRVSKHWVTQCPFCKVVLCIRCTCPAWGAPPHPKNAELPS